MCCTSAHDFLLRSRERCRSIVISTSVCVFVCLSASISPERHARSLPISLCCLLPWLASPPAGWRNPKGKGNSTGSPGLPKPLAIYGKYATSYGQHTWLPRSLHKGSFNRQRHECSIIQYDRQAQTEIRKMLSAGNATYRPGRGWRECTTRAKSDIYDGVVSRYCWMSSMQVHMVAQRISSRPQRRFRSTSDLWWRYRNSTGNGACRGNLPVRSPQPVRYEPHSRAHVHRFQLGDR